MRVDLNADIGEASGNDVRLVRAITSGSVACGLHGGDPSLMRQTVRLAAEAGVAIGAHPGFADRAGLGRQELPIAVDAIEDLVLYQLGALTALAGQEGVRLQHVKPHGGLYNLAARRADVADAVARAVAAFDRSLVLVGLSGSQLVSAAARCGLTAAAEGFADRAYEPDGSLVSRSVPGSVLQDREQVVSRAVRMICDGSVEARDGSVIAVRVETLCIHGDTPGAGDLAHALRAGLEGAGIRVLALSAT